MEVKTSESFILKSTKKANCFFVSAKIKHKPFKTVKSLTTDNAQNAKIFICKCAANNYVKFLTIQNQKEWKVVPFSTHAESE